MTPKPKRWSFWLVSATALLSIGAWQAAQITLDAKTRAMAAVKTPPKKTRSDGRISLAKELAQADPVGTYVARAKRGMTEQEIGWILEDFYFLGLDRTTDPTHYRERRLHQAAWYLDALEDGLSLSPGQKEQARAKLEQIRETGEKAYAERLAREPKDRDPLDKMDFGWILDYVDSVRWLGRGKADPWDLCELTDQQILLTDKNRSNPSKGRANEWSPRPDEDGIARGTPTTTSDASAIMLPQLALPGEAASDCEQAKHLQPAQLKLVLLFHPERAAPLTAELERKDREQSDPPVATEPSTPQTPGDE